MYLLFYKVQYLENLLFQKNQTKKLRRKINRGAKQIQDKQQVLKVAPKARRGRMKKAKPKKQLKINGLDLLHHETLLSTSPQAAGKQLSPAPGTVDQKLTTLTSEMILHDELDIPESPSTTPYGLQVLLDMFKGQYMQILQQMRNPHYKILVKNQIEDEKERNEKLKNRAAQLEKQIKVLIDDSVALLKARMSELGINASSPVDLLTKAKEIVCRHKELQAKASKLQGQVASLEEEKDQLVAQRQAEVCEKYIGPVVNPNLSPNVAQEYILREISATLSHRKKLQNEVSKLEGDIISMQKSNEERKQLPMLAARQQQQPTKVFRKSRDYRARSQDWPDVPDIAKIEEQNPEILAQKILETGRKIEASRMSNISNKIPIYNHSKPVPNHSKTVVRNSMPAPLPVTKRQKIAHNNYPPQKVSPVVANNINNTINNNISKSQDPPRLTNFEDRLKSIITSVLNEDQQNRTKQAQAPLFQQYSNHPNNTANFQQYNNPNYPPHPYPNHIQNSFVQPKEDKQRKYQTTTQNRNKYNVRCETVVRQNEEYRHFPQPEGLAGMMEGYNDDNHKVLPQIHNARQQSMEQPDYTQVSPAKLALRKHLSQEKLAQQQLPYNTSEGIVATRTIGKWEFFIFLFFITIFRINLFHHEGNFEEFNF